MRHFLGFAVSWFLYFPAFAQDAQTVTLVFVTPANDNVGNYEAVIDDVSYFSENNSSFNNQDNRNKSSVNRDIIYLNNFQAGRHAIQVYSLKNGSNEERNGNTPVYSSSFNVRESFDTKIAIRGNGQVQFSERQSVFNNSVANNRQRNNNDVRRDDNASASDNIGPDNNNTTDNDQSGKRANGTYNKHGNSNDVDNASIPNTTQAHNGSYNQNTGVNRRSASKRDGTFAKDDNAGSTTEGANQNSRIDTDPSEPGNRNFDHENNNAQIINKGLGSKHTRINSKPPLADYQFNYLYETFSKQWLPGQKMKNINNEFANSGDNFTTVQVTKLIALVTEEGNRLQLAKSVYHAITDPENFSQVCDLLKLESSREDLNKFIDNFQDQ
jgi:hypothetical protein